MEDTTLQKYALMISFMLPDGMLDWFDVIRVEETDKEESNNELDILFCNALHIYLDERDNRTGEYLGFLPNGFTEATVIHDYPVRNRKLVLHVRRRRYLDADKRNVILCNFPLGQRVPVSPSNSVFFLKTVLDNLPVTASSVGKFYHIKGSTLERYYKHHLSDFSNWNQKEHAQE